MMTDPASAMSLGGGGGGSSLGGFDPSTGFQSGSGQDFMSGTGNGGSAGEPGYMSDLTSAGGQGYTSGSGQDYYGGNPIADPNVGAPQSQASAVPGQPPTAIGGTQSGPPQAGQLGQSLQQTIQQIQGNQGPRAGQGYGGGPQPQQGPTGFTPQQGQGFGGGSPTQVASNLAPSLQRLVNQAPQGNVPIGTTGEPIPPSDITTPTPPGTTSPGQPPPEGASPESTPSVDQPPAAAKTNGKTAPTATDAATLPTGGKTAGETPPTGTTTGQTGTSAGQTGTGYGGGSPTQQQQTNPIKFLGDIVRAMFGDPSGLLQDLAGQSGSWESPGNPPGVPPWAPGYGPQSRINPNSPEARRIAAQAGRAGRTGRAGRAGRTSAGPQDTTPPGPSVAQQQGDVQKAISQGERDPFGTTGWPESGKPDPLAPSFGPQGSTATAWKNAAPVAGNRLYAHPGGQLNQQIAAQPPGNIANNFGQPFDQNLASDRQRNAEIIRSNPALFERVLRAGQNEQGHNAQGAQAVFETMFNRASMENVPINSHRATGWVTQGGYYDDRRNPGGAPVTGARRQMLMQAFNNAARGSNISNYSTDNDSQQWGWNRSHGMFQMRSTYGGEYFSQPNSMGPHGSGFVPEYNNWLRRMQGNPGPQSSITPPRGADWRIIPNRTSGLDMLAS